MKTLRVTLADIIGPTGAPNSTATVHARYVDTSGRGRDVHLTDGTIVVPVRRVASPDGDPEVFDFDVYANDAAPVREVDYGHLVEVSWTVVAPTGAKSSGVKRVQITDSMASVVQLGLLATPTPVPPYTGGYVLPGELDALDARVVVLEESPGGGGGGVTVHGLLTGRDAADQHPMAAITGLDAALAGKATSAQGAAADAALPAAAAPELIRDTMATALVAGANVTITPNDGADTITIAASGGGGGGGVSADPGNTATLGTDNLIYVPKAIGIEPGASTAAPNVNINGRAGGNVNATTSDRVISHYNPEAFACDEIGLIHRSGNVSATYRLAIWSGYPNPGLVFTTPEFSVPTTGEAAVVFTVPGGTVFPRGVWYIGFVLTSGTSGTFNSGGRDTSFEPNRDANNAGALTPSNFGVVSLGWTPPATLTLDSAWAAGATPQLLAKNLRFV